MSISRRKLVGLSAAAGVSGFLGGSEHPISAQENDGVSLRNIALPKGKIVSLSCNATEAATWSLASKEVHRVVNDTDMLWSSEGNVFRGSPDIELADWRSLDLFLSTASRYELMVAVQSLIFGDMGFGQSTTEIRRVPAWLTEGGFSYDESIDIGIEHIDHCISYVLEKGGYDGSDITLGDQLRFGVINEYLNDNVGSDGSLIINVDDPGTWFKHSNYWQDQASLFEDPGLNGIPRYFRQFLIAARAAAPFAKLGISDWAIETWKDYRWGGPNQKTQALYNLIAAMQDDPELRDIVNSNFYVGMQAHWSGEEIRRAGVNTFASDVGETVARFRALGIDVILTECTISQDQLPGGIDEQEEIAANMWREIPVAALRAGASELTIFGVDYGGGPYRATVFDSTFGKKPAYYALAEGIASLPNVRE